ncbi:MAG: hypothetical protein HY903_05330 [Deltaproteobacteria bacterium]|nr:hypothetical protein [Deltaproteobacteria bacterium]
MAILTMVAGLLLAVGLLIREHQLQRQRRQDADLHRQLASALADHRNQLRRTQEDLYVMRALLEEKHLLDAHDVARGRIRLVEGPRRAAAEREHLARSLGVQATQFVIDEDLEKVH